MKTRITLYSFSLCLSCMLSLSLVFSPLYSLSFFPFIFYYYSLSLTHLSSLSPLFSLSAFIIWYYPSKEFLKTILAIKIQFLFFECNLLGLLWLHFRSSLAPFTRCRWESKARTVFPGSEEKKNVCWQSRNATTDATRRFTHFL